MTLCLNARISIMMRGNYSPEANWYLKILLRINHVYLRQKSLKSESQFTAFPLCSGEICFLLDSWLLLLNAEHAEHERLTNERCRMVGGTISMRVLNTHTHTTCINAYKHALTYHSWRMLAAFLTQTQHRSKTSANTVFFSVMSVVTRLSLCARLI